MEEVKEKPHRFFAVVELDTGDGKTQIATLKSPRQKALKAMMNTIEIKRVIAVFRGKQLDVQKKEILTF